MCVCVSVPLESVLALNIQNLFLTSLESSSRIFIRKRMSVLFSSWDSPSPKAFNVLFWHMHAASTLEKNKTK